MAQSRSHHATRPLRPWLLAATMAMVLTLGLVQPANAASPAASDAGSSTSTAPTNIGASRTGTDTGTGTDEDIFIPDEPIVDETQTLPQETVFASTHAQTPKDAVRAAAAYGNKGGVNTYVSVVDRQSGRTLAETPNANQHVPSESIFKLFVAAYYLVKHRGYQHTSAKMRGDLSYMIRLSDDATASRLFRADIIPTIAKRYGLKHTANAAGRVGHWGSARITAHDMAQFMYRAANDPLVGPWLLPVMAKTAAHGSDGFNQHFGLNALNGAHGSKQGWGADGAANTKYAINSVGYTNRYYVAVLTVAKTYPDPARAVATYAAKLIRASIRAPAEGEFVRRAGGSDLYRVAGAAPIFVSSWAAVGGKHHVRTIDAVAWAQLRKVPKDGTIVRAGTHGTAYRISGGALTRASAGQVRGKQVIVIDKAAVERAGGSGVWSHLRLAAADAACQPFPDVNGLNVHCDNITWLAGQKITKPAGKLYYPSSTVKRGAMTAFLFRLVNPGKPQPACTSKPFPDVTTHYLFCGYTAWAAKHDVAFGYPDGDYGPDNEVTRGAMAAYLYRIAGPGGAAKGCTAKPFDDVATDDTFCGVITWMVKNGITYGVGDGSDYGTRQPVTRQAMASFLHRIDDHMK